MPLEFSFSLSRVFQKLLLLVLVGLGLSLAFIANPVQAAGTGEKVGRESGLPIPRFVSLKAKTVNLRVGPGRKYAIDWNYRRKGLPVEVIQEFDQWRRIRDSEGTTGWVLHSLLSSRRTALVAPWEIKKEGAMTRAAFIEGKDAARGEAETIARVQAGLLVDISQCSGGWCALEKQNVKFWLKQDYLWGVYPNEALDG